MAAVTKRIAKNNKTTTSASKAGIPRRRHRHRHPREDRREDVRVGVGVVELQLKSTRHFGDFTFRSFVYCRFTKLHDRHIPTGYRNPDS